jgi:hypothetical protein
MRATGGHVLGCDLLLLFRCIYYLHVLLIFTSVDIWIFTHEKYFHSAILTIHVLCKKFIWGWTVVAIGELNCLLIWLLTASYFILRSMFSSMKVILYCPSSACAVSNFTRVSWIMLHDSVAHCVGRASIVRSPSCCQVSARQFRRPLRTPVPGLARSLPAGPPNRGWDQQIKRGIKRPRGDDRARISLSTLKEINNDSHDAVFKCHLNFLPAVITKLTTY